MAENTANNQEEKGLLARIFGLGSEQVRESRYRRKLFDGRIERYLDSNLDSFISEYGIVTGLDIEAYEERYTRLTGRISEMSEYMADADAIISGLERTLSGLNSGSINRK